MTISYSFGVEPLFVANNSKEVIFGYGDKLYKLGDLDEIIYNNLSLVSKYISLRYLAKCDHIQKDEFLYHSDLEKSYSFRIVYYSDIRTDLEYRSNFNNKFDVHIYPMELTLCLEINEDNSKRVPSGVYELFLDPRGVVITKEREIIISSLDRSDWEELTYIMTINKELGVYALSSFLNYSIEKWIGTVMSENYHSIIEKYIREFIASKQKEE